MDALSEGFAGREGRRNMLDEYVESGEAGEPWIIPSGQIDVEQVRPLTLSDLALADFVKLDKATVASILGVPPFVLGVGEFRSLYSYDLKDLADIADAQYIRGIMSGNEVRDMIGMPPAPGLDERVILENYLPIDRIGDQKKLVQ